MHRSNARPAPGAAEALHLPQDALDGILRHMDEAERREFRCIDMLASRGTTYRASGSGRRRLLIAGTKARAAANQAVTVIRHEYRRTVSL